MIIVLKEHPAERQLRDLQEWLESLGVRIHRSEGLHHTILGLVGDTSAVDMDLIKALDFVEDVKRIQEPYKNANRKFHPQDTVVRIGPLRLGGGDFQMIAGPCSIESEEQICSIAEAVKAAGATMLRGGAFKPRTSPYAFQGLGREGIDLLLKARRRTGLPIVTELMDLSQLDDFADVDVIQVGARNMQNFAMLKCLGRCRKPILLKRGLSSTYQEWLMSAEYVMAGGNEAVILCERGIRTFETHTRNTLDLAAVPAVRALSHLPIVVDPSHATGMARLVPPMALAAVAAGADGLMIEVHDDPAHALCDGPQSILPETFARLSGRVRELRALMRSFQDR